MPTLPDSWKVIALLAMLAVNNFVVWHVNDVFHEAAAKAELEAQVKAAHKRQEKAQDAARQAEADLLTERQKRATIERKWRTALAKPHSTCTLPDDALLLLQDATAPAR